MEVTNKDFIGKEIKAVPKEEKNFGVDTQDILINNIANAAISSTLDTTDLENFLSVAQTRENYYQILDSMKDDNIVKSIIEAYAENATESNESGDKVWVESEDPNVTKYVTYLLKALQVNKNIYAWTSSFITYGDVYLKKFRQSEYEDDLFDSEEIATKQKLNEAKAGNTQVLIEKSDTENSDENDDIESEEKEQLDEGLRIAYFPETDHFTNYVEMVANPGEMFELTKFGKTMGYIKAPYNVYNTKLATDRQDALWLNQLQYNVSKGDVTLYQATDYVHAIMDSGDNRVEETVNIYQDDTDKEGNVNAKAYNVKRGRSMLYDWYKTWREMTLLEDAIILNRLTKSSLVRIIQIEVGDMPKDMISSHLQSIKSMMEQKGALDTKNKYNEYTNPAPVENNIYVPTHEGKGNISVANVGGEYDPKQLTDLEYFRDKFFGSTGIPKQYCLRGDTKLHLLNGEVITIEQMFNNKDTYLGKGILGCNIDGSLQPTTIKDIMLTKPSTDFIRIYLDNGKYVDVTDEHLMMMRDGSFVEAKDIKVGDSFMPYYSKYKDGRKFVLDNKLGKYLPQYRVVANKKFGEIAKGNQIHHIDCIKANDDFDNLENLTVEEHYQKHEDMLHRQNKESYKVKKEKGIDPKCKGARMITNSIENHWLFEGETLPDGYWFGADAYFTDEKKKEYGERLSKLHKDHPEMMQGFGGYKKGEATPETIAHLKEAKKKFFDNMTDQERQEWHDKYAEIARKNHDKITKIQIENLMKTKPDVVHQDRYTRCPVCDSITLRNISNGDYNKYLNKSKFYYCCKDHEKLINGGGKLGRSYDLLRENNFDYDNYAEARWEQESRPDTYFLSERLQGIVDKYLSSYIPECNHKVVKIERINVSEPSYDITVNDECHTFALDCGIFVHNCGFTEDGAGFNGGESLSIISSQFSKRVKRIQSDLISMLEDLVNSLLYDRKLYTYINNFRLKMVEPMSKDDADRKDAQTNALGVLRDLMDVLSDVQDIPTRLKIIKAYLQPIINDNDVMQYLQDEIDRLENEPEEEQNPENNEEGGMNSPRSLGGSERPSRDQALDNVGEEIFGGEENTETELGGEETTEETSSANDYLPSFAELGVNSNDITEQ